MCCEDKSRTIAMQQAIIEELEEELVKRDRTIRMYRQLVLNKQSKEITNERNVL